MTQSRNSNIQNHRSRPINAAKGAHDHRPEETGEEEKITYIEFINRLMHKMKMDSVKRMLEAALNELD